MDDFVIVLLVFVSVYVLPTILGWWGVFRKAGRPGWLAFVPIYNVYVLVVHVAQLSLLWFILVFVPVIQIIPAVLVNVEVAKRFGRSESYGLGLTLLGFILYPVLGFGPARYRR